MSTLHITNGDGAADLLKASTIGGDVLPWRDPMHHGPFPAGIGLDALAGVRADYLCGPGLDRDETHRAFRLRDEHLASAARYDGVILWFEHDLLDQLQILQLLDWFHDTGFDRAKLALICIDHFEGVPGFRGLGNLTPEQVATLLERRQPVTSQQLELASVGWRAFRSPDPRDLEQFLAGDLGPLPFLGPALRRHLEEYPWRQDGLTRTERQILRLVADGISAPGKLFTENMNLEEVLFLGDWTTFRHIAGLCRAAIPLLRCTPGPTFECPPEMEIPRTEFLAQRLSLTDDGKRVLAGDLHARQALARDIWLGGVALDSGAAMWMWDADNRRLELVP